MPNRNYGAIALTGGGDGALDALDGATFIDGDGAIVITASNFYVYTLDADSGLDEDVPDVIKPDTNAGDKRWTLVRLIKSIVSDPASGEMSIDSIKFGSGGELIIVYNNTPIA